MTALPEAYPLRAYRPEQRAPNRHDEAACSPLRQFRRGGEHRLPAVAARQRVRAGRPCVLAWRAQARGQQLTACPDLDSVGHGPLPGRQIAQACRRPAGRGRPHTAPLRRRRTWCSDYPPELRTKSRLARITDDSGPPVKADRRTHDRGEQALPLCRVLRNAWAATALDCSGLWVRRPGSGYRTLPPIGEDGPVGATTGAASRAR